MVLSSSPIRRFARVPGTLRVLLMLRVSAQLGIEGQVLATLVPGNGNAISRESTNTCADAREVPPLRPVSMWQEWNGKDEAKWQEGRLSL